MNYRHEFHAGNFADVMKHTLLIILLEALNRKPAAWYYFDTHAGAGGYDLTGKAAAKTAEAAGGIGRLWPQRSTAPAPVQQLCAVVTGVNAALAPGTTPRFYPGSPSVAAALACAQDRLVLAELQPQEHRLLRDRFRGDPRVALHARDGYEMLKALVPPPEHRGLVLMDPPFEQPDEFDAQLEALRIAHSRWSNGVYALWYPMKDETVVRRFYRRLTESGLPRLLVAEFRVAPAAAQLFSACGMLVVNPPWQSDAAMNEALRFLATVLAPGCGGSAVRWLTSA
ncbi:MAG TPA: 23S rRNA (adenine(2030)-N(6))-methyltransferase RlmJ [Gammaproteobacteria bacterium]|nr:23S rRNA (adenine(2030)-N(6))-methyltransferase RlmJ [Gammaproteobacteria bacterium]